MFGSSRSIILSRYLAVEITNFKKMTDRKVGSAGAIDKSKKQKAVSHVWRPISTRSITVEDGGGQVREVRCSTSSFISSSEQAMDVVEEVAEVADRCISSSTLGDVEDSAFKGESVLSKEKHSLAVEVGASLIRLIKRKGHTQQKIEEEMGVKIIIPSSSEEESVIIEGDSIKSVSRASEKVQALIDEAVNSPSLDYSHFISLPLAIHPELVDKLVNFQNSILGDGDASLDQTVKSNSDEDTSNNEKKDQESSKGNNVVVELKVEDDRRVKVDLTSVPFVSYAPKASKSPALSDLGIDRSIFIKPKTFHLTVLMLKLWNKKRVNAASEVLKSVSMKVMDALDNRPLSVRLKGLDCMRGSMAKARVLYATVEEIGNENRLLQACQVIIDAFVEAGLVLEKDAKQKLKLHATVMNARHSKGKTRRKKHDSFDARGIFKQFGSEEWGVYPILEAHLSQRFAFDANGYYHCCASIPFPEIVQAD